MFCVDADVYVAAGAPVCAEREYKWNAKRAQEIFTLENVS